MNASPNSSAEGYAVSHREICDFDSIAFSAVLEAGRLTATIDNSRTGGKPLVASVAANGTVDLWMHWRSGGKSFDMKLNGRFSDSAFIGSTYGTFQATAGRNPIEWACRTDIFMAHAPLKVEDVINAKALLGSGATRDAILANLEEKAKVASTSSPQAVAPIAATSSVSVPTPSALRLPAEQNAPEPLHVSPSLAPSAPAAVGSSTPADELTRQLAMMKQLLDGGLIGQTEFEGRRRALLDKAFGGVPDDPPALASAQPTQPPQVASKAAQSTLARQVTPGTTGPAASGPVPAIDWGRYHALVIGINDYRELPKLETAINDALRVADLLERQYGFTIHKLINPTQQELVDALDVLRETLTGSDNLLIYYAGHGYLDESAGRGYWLPVDAQPNRRSKWVSNTTITDTLRTLLAKHVMIVADSCFSGTLSRDAKINLRTADYWERIASKTARVTLTSGGLEPVADNNSRGHSPFAAAFIEALQEYTGIIDGTSLFTAMRRPVMLNANQTPEYSDVRSAGHDGGDFVFVRRR